MGEIVKFNNFIFDSSSGELTDTLSKNKEEVIRLSPQSAKLLQTLIQSYPKLVSKDEIKDLLWPDVKVDFDNSLHFCVRQIRAALHDNVSSPKYIETIPRRGYRWLVEVGPIKKNKKRIIRWSLAVLLLIIVVISISNYLSRSNKESEVTATRDQANIRLIIMPLQPTDSTNLFYGNMIAYNLLDLLSNINGIGVIGPTTTQNVNQESIYDFIENADADYMINGKFSGSKQESSLLIEIIRNSDKTHVWVATYKADSQFDHITSEIYDEFSELMKTQ